LKARIPLQELQGNVPCGREWDSWNFDVALSSKLVILYSLSMWRADEIGAVVGNLSLKLSDELPQHWPIGSWERNQEQSDPLRSLCCMSDRKTRFRNWQCCLQFSAAMMNPWLVERRFIDSVKMFSDQYTLLFGNIIMFIDFTLGFWA